MCEPTAAELSLFVISDPQLLSVAIPSNNLCIYILHRVSEKTVKIVFVITLSNFY